MGDCSLSWAAGFHWVVLRKHLWCGGARASSDSSFSVSDPLLTSDLGRHPVGSSSRAPLVSPVSRTCGGSGSSGRYVVSLGASPVRTCFRCSVRS